MKRNIIAWALFSAVLILSSCASKRAVVAVKQPDNTVQPKVETSMSQDLKALSFVQKVSDQRVYAQNIVGNMSFSVKTGDKNISAPGSIHMRKDKVIRLQVFIPLLGSEVGRVEFTPDYVLVIDRLHKEYVKADYSQLDFLKNNGLSFYSLQAFFWNMLLVPGQQNVSEPDLKNFSVDLNSTGSTIPVSLKNGNITYRWNANKANGQILSSIVNYVSSNHGQSTLTWNYQRFMPVGVKQFPALQTIDFMTTATATKKQGQVILDIDQVTTDSNWDELTTVSDRYRKIEVKDILSKLFNF